MKNKKILLCLLMMILTMFTACRKKEDTYWIDERGVLMYQESPVIAEMFQLPKNDVGQILIPILGGEMLRPTNVHFHFNNWSLLDPEVQEERPRLYLPQQPDTPFLVFYDTLIEIIVERPGKEKIQVFLQGNSGIAQRFLQQVLPEMADSWYREKVNDNLQEIFAKLSNLHSKLQKFDKTDIENFSFAYGVEVLNESGVVPMLTEHCTMIGGDIPTAYHDWMIELILEEAKSKGLSIATYKVEDLAGRLLNNGKLISVDPKTGQVSFMDPEDSIGFILNNYNRI